MNQRIMQRLTLYDPLQLDINSFKLGFVARKKELTQLVKRIEKATKDDGNNLHTLIYAHRGMGKTSLLRRIGIAVGEDVSLCEQWIPLNFREEQYNLASLQALWRNCADPLAGWCERVGDGDSANKLDDLIDSNDRDIDFLAEINAICRAHDRRLLLLIDNFDLILSALSPEAQWQLRGVLQAKNAPLLFACTASLPSELSDEQAAFYEFFRTQQLSPLSETDLTDCLRGIAKTRGELGKNALIEINADPTRIKVLHRLCGGNPRTLMIIYQVIETMASMKQNDDFQALLEEVLESVTPLYKARTEELAPQQRQIIDAVALHWNPLTQTTIANITGLATTSVSSQVKRLEKMGILENTGRYQSKHLFQLAERFYNIWYLMRNGSRRHKRKLIWFSKFFADYYSQDELVQKARKQIEHRFMDDILFEPLINSIQDSSMRYAIIREYSQKLLAPLNLDEIERMPTSEIVEEEALTFQKMLRKLQKNLAGKLNNPAEINAFIDKVRGSLSLSLEAKMRIAEADLSLAQITALTEVFDDEIREFKKILPEAGFQSLTQALYAGKMSSSSDIKGLMACCSDNNSTSLLNIFLEKFTNYEQIQSALEDKHLRNEFHAFLESKKEGISAPAWNVLGNLYKNHLKDDEAAKDAYLNAIRIDEDYAYPWNGLGNLYKDHLKDDEAAKDAYLNAIRIDENFSYPWNGLGNLYQLHLKEYEAAKDAYLNAIRIDENFAYPWNGLGNLYQYCLEDYEAAKDAYLNAIRIDKGWAAPWNGLGNLYKNHLKDDEAAKDAYLSAIRIDKDYAYPWANLGNLYQAHLKDYEAAKDAYLNAIRIDEHYASPWNDLGTLYQLHLKDYEAAKDAYLNAIRIDKNSADFWNGLGNLYQDHLKDYQAAKDAYKTAIALEDNDMAKGNLVWLGIATNDNTLIDQYQPQIHLDPPGNMLIDSALALRNNQLGSALAGLKAVLQENSPLLWANYRDDLMRFVALCQQRGFYPHLMDFLRENRFHETHAPFVIALEAIEKGESYFKTINPEMRPEAESMYGYLASSLDLDSHAKK